MPPAREAKPRPTAPRQYSAAQTAVMRGLGTRRTPRGFCRALHQTTSAGARPPRTKPPCQAQAPCASTSPVRRPLSCSGQQTIQNFRTSQLQAGLGLAHRLFGGSMVHAAHEPKPLADSKKATPQMPNGCNYQLQSSAQAARHVVGSCNSRVIHTKVHNWQWMCGLMLRADACSEFRPADTTMARSAKCTWQY